MVDATRYSLPSDVDSFSVHCIIMINVSKVIKLDTNQLNQKDKTRLGIDLSNAPMPV